MSLPQKNPLEWAVFGISLLLVGATLAFLVYQTVVPSTDTPMLTVQASPVEPIGEDLSVEVEVANTGGPAEAVLVEVSLPQPDGSMATVELQFDRLAYGERASGTAIFPGAEAPSGPPTAAVTGYLPVR